MSEQPDQNSLPQDDHLREDIGAGEPENESAAEFDGEHFTSGLTNTGQEVPGLSPNGEYGERDDPEREHGTAQNGFLPEPD